MSQGGDYLLAVKGNQQTLFEAVKQVLSGSIDDTLLCYEQGHGRYEARAYHVMDAGQLRDDFPEWTGLNSIGVALGYRHVNGQDTLV